MHYLALHRNTREMTVEMVNPFNVILLLKTASSIRLGIKIRHDEPYSHLIRRYWRWSQSYYSRKNQLYRPLFFL